MLYEKLFIRISLDTLIQELSILAHTLTDSFTHWLTYTLTDYHTKPSNFPPTTHIHTRFITENIYRLCYLYFLVPRTRHQGVLHSGRRPGGVDDQEEHRSRHRPCHQVRESGVERSGDGDSRCSGSERSSSRLGVWLV